MFEDMVIRLGRLQIDTATTNVPAAIRVGPFKLALISTWEFDYRLFTFYTVAKPRYHDVIQSWATRR